MYRTAAYAEGCLAGLNSEVGRQTVVIRTDDISPEFAAEVIDMIVERLPSRNLRLQIIRCSPRNALVVATHGDPLTGGRRGAAPVLVMTDASKVIELVIVPVGKAPGGAIMGGQVVAAAHYAHLASPATARPPMVSMRAACS